jgi:hypothetical protein
MSWLLWYVSYPAYYDRTECACELGMLARRGRLVQERTSSMTSWILASTNQQPMMRGRSRSCPASCYMSLGIIMMSSATLSSSS